MAAKTKQEAMIRNSINELGDFKNCKHSNLGPARVSRAINYHAVLQRKCHDCNIWIVPGLWLKDVYERCVSTFKD